mmetsp:Transcript_140609/g.269675  ORF Transcript_140609/g.269675 Transcript_140609/m.269675 type:complete len:601 (-) Transcript_140609:17-1819(-)
MMHMSIARCATASVIGASLIHRQSRLHLPRDHHCRFGGHLHCDTQPGGPLEQFSVKRAELISTLDNQKVDNIYELKGDLGEGGFGSVHIGKHRQTGVKRAIKIIPKKHTTPEAFRIEAEALSELDHPNIIKVIEYFQDHKHYYLVQELCTGPDIRDIIIDAPGGQISERDISIMIGQCIKSVIGCHAHGFVHRDIKLENFMVTSQDKNVKLIDFGLSARLGDTGTAQGIAGTDVYMAPEMLSAGPRKEYGKSVDVWGLGVTLFSMLSGELLIEIDESFKVGSIYECEVAPGLWKDVKLIAKGENGWFDGELLQAKGTAFFNIKEIQLRHNSYKEVKRVLSDPDFVEKRLQCEALQSRQVSVEAMDLMRKMLCYQPAQRITTDEALRHPFILQYGQEDLGGKASEEGQSGSDTELEAKIRRFVGLSRLEQTAFMSMAHLAAEGTMGGKLIEIRRIFRRIDTDGDGEISMDDLKNSFAENNSAVPPDMNELFQACHTSGLRCTLSYVEFVAIQLASYEIDEKLCTAGFMLIDRNHSGELDVEDLALMCRHLKHVNFSDLLLQAELKLRPKEQCTRTLSLEDFHTLIRGAEAVKREPPRMPVQ